jgi:hypothetical protein
MKNVTLTMKDEFSGETVKRTISGLNACSSGNACWELKGQQDQRNNLERWISERANSQHETILSLVSWVFED